jgi:hypothetical protein
MGALEDDEMTATKLVSDQLVKRAQYIGELLREGNRGVIGYLQETIIWVFVSRAVLESLAAAASSRSLSSATELVDLQARIKTILRNIEVPDPKTDDDADKAQRMLSENAAKLLQSYQDVPRFDRAVALKVWATHRQVLGQLARAKDMAGLRAAIMEVIKQGLETALGVGFLTGILEVFRKLDRRSGQAQTTSDFLDFLDSLRLAYIVWSVQCQCQIYRLKSQHSGATEEQLLQHAQKDLLKIFEGMLKLAAELQRDIKPGA